MKYNRHLSKYQLSRENSPERKSSEAQLIMDFLDLYRNPEELNVKVPGKLFKEELNQIGVLLQEMSRKIASDKSQNTEIHDLLKKHPVPKRAKELLPEEFRVFSLLLNALKQWVSAEQTATDKVLLGSGYKKKLKSHISHCIVSNEQLQYDQKGFVNFHHTLRDGRIPIPLTKEAHDLIEGQIKKAVKLKVNK